MEQAFQAFGKQQAGTALDEAFDTWQRVKSYGLRSDLLAVSHVWQPVGKNARLVAAKGAPEAIAELCELSGETRDRVETEVAEMARAVSGS